MVPIAETSRPRGLMLAFALVFAVAVGVALTLARRTGIVAFASLAGVSVWALVVALANTLPRLPFRLRGLFCAIGILATIAVPATFYLLRNVVFTGATDSLLQLAAVVLAILAFSFHFLATYGQHVTRETPTAALAAIVPLARLLAAAHALVVSALLARLYAQRNWLHAVEIAINITTAMLVAEAVVQSLARQYQPARLRAQETIFGRSVVLPAVFGERGPLRSLAATMEKTFGGRLADTWLVQLGRVLLAPLVLLGALGLWLSTAATRVPVDSRGVLVQRGVFATPALPPGLHFHAPWPWAQIVTVTTERVQEISLGFERDLAGPVLWAEKHFEGEQNLLVGQGEELLTINVPLQYRIRDAVAFLRHAGDARAALEALGYRELLAITTTHTAFGLMTTDRAEITEKLQHNLQAAVDRLQLGLEIVFVGLKDVHPPVSVAPAYQDVVSAEEQRIAFADLARTYAVQATAAAHVSASQIRLQARTAATERRFRAQGEASRFLAPLAAYRAQPGVFETRRRLESLEAALVDLRQLILVPPEARARANFYLGFDPAAPLPTVPR
jgi:regulator of protease activity HflC (stomatin/prohibitin superfamily)